MGKPDGNGQYINDVPNLAKIMEKSGISFDEWNAFESKIKVNKELVTALKIRHNIQSITEKELPKVSVEDGAMSEGEKSPPRLSLRSTQNNRQK